MAFKCIGRNALSGEAIEIEGEGAITHCEPLLGKIPDDLPFLAPGFIDIQVNGFAGVDYNSEHTSLDEIARSIHVIYSSGVSRFFPTVITGGVVASERTVRGRPRHAHTP